MLTEARRHRVFVAFDADIAVLPRREWVAGVVRAALRSADAPGGSVAVRIVDARAIRALNREFRHVDEPTDVLSFPDGEEWPGAGQARHLGDIALAWEVCVAQAAERGRPTREEAALLLVHGVMHLLGHDHADLEEKQRMQAAERAALAMRFRRPPVVDY